LLPFQPDSEAEEENDNEDPIDMSFPMEGGWKKILVYLVSFPIMAPLFYTLPDTKNKESKQKLRFFNGFTIIKLDCS
jgi:hypothetical protein